MNIIRFFRFQLAMTFYDINHRTIGMLLQYFINFFPDLFVFIPLRILILKIAGVKINNLSGLVVRKNIFIEYPKNLILEEGVQINVNCYIGNNENVRIGKNSRLAAGVMILTVRHKGLNFKGPDIWSPVIIGDGVHIGAAAILMPGTIIGKNTIVGPGSVVSGTLKDDAIYMGNPARYIGARDDI